MSEALSLNENRLYTAAEVNNLLILVGEKIKQEYAKDLETIKKSNLKTSRCFYCDVLIIKGYESLVFEYTPECNKCKLSICWPCFKKIKRKFNIGHSYFFRDNVKTGWKFMNPPSYYECPKCSNPD